VITINMRLLLVTSITIFILALLGTVFHFIYTGDIVANAFGGNYYVSIIAMPIAFSLFIASITNWLLRKRHDIALKGSIGLVASSMLGAVLPIGFVLWAMNQPH
ncbi:MAG: hypothetical protein OQK13_02835, partial [Gammaproteobacteria bacterium]|nr:hypothetical protein [Gammaproteobacteria bacterium]